MNETGNEKGRTGQARTGKVARLPVEARNVVNQSMREGKRQAEIIADLEALGFDGITKSNLTRWRRGGYGEWLREQEAFERLHEMSAEEKGLQGQLQPGGRNALADLGEAMLASHLSEMLRSFNAESRAAGAEDFLRLARAFTGFMMARAQRQRVELERGKQELELRKKKAKPRERKGMTAEEMAEFKAKIRLI